MSVGEKMKNRNKTIRNVPIPETNLDVEGLIPLQILKQIAKSHAQEVWGEKIRCGEPLPLSDANGDVNVYAFPIIKDNKCFPENEVIFEEIRSIYRKFREKGNEKVLEELNNYCNQFGTVYISATKKDFPVKLLTHTLHPFFLDYDIIRDISSAYLKKAEPKLEKIYFLNSHQEYFEFTDESNRILIEANSLEIKDPEEVLTPTDDQWSDKLKEVMDDVWAHALSNVPLGLNPEEPSVTHTEKKIQYWELVPPVPHTWWCVPTSYNMIMGFWDHYVPGIGSFAGFGRIIKYWFEHSKFCHLPSGAHIDCKNNLAIPNNVPSCTDELIDPTIGNWREGFNGFEDFISKTYNYNFKVGGTADNQEVSEKNDWAWNDIKNQVETGYPFFWSFAAHTTVGIGYRVDSNGQKFVIYLDTYGANLQQKLKEKPYADGNGFTWLKPGNGTFPEHSILVSPRGDEVIPSSVPSEIKWFVWGKKIDRTNIYFSSDSGKSWKEMASNIKNRSGWNSYIWLPGNAIEGRVRVQCYAGNDIISEDGSLNDFNIQKQVAGGSWKNIFGPVEKVVAGYSKSGGRLIFASEPDTGDIYQFMGKPGGTYNWIKIGGPAKKFVLDGKGQLYNLSSDGSGIHKYTGTPMKWIQIGGPAKEIYGDVEGVLYTEPNTGDIYRYLGAAFSWLKIGGPGKQFASDAKGIVYALSPNGDSVWCYDGLFGPIKKWIQIGGPAEDLYVRGNGIYATNPQNGDIFIFNGIPFIWTRIGSAGKTFSVDVEGRLYGLSPDSSGVWRYEGSFEDPSNWIKIGGPSTNIFAGWNEVLAVNPPNNDLWIHIQ